MRHVRIAALGAATFLVVGGAAVLTAPAAQAESIGWQHRNTDFDGNGYDDVVVAAPSATISGVQWAGYVAVQYSSSSGVSTTKKTLLSQNTSGVPGAAEAADGFGKAVASGDLNGDKYDDLVVGVPGEDLGTLSNAGGATVFWGSSTGLHGSDSTWLQSIEPRAGANFGKALEAAMYFAPDPTDPELVRHDSIAALENDELMFFTYDSTAQTAAESLKATAAGARGLGALADEATITLMNLSHGNYNEDPYADLAFSGVINADGGPVGITFVAHGAQNFEDMSDGGTFYQGPSIVSSDFNSDGQDDLAIGDTTENSAPAGGSVSVYLGQGDLSGLSNTPALTWTQNTPGIPGGNENGDEWGADLSAGDTNGDNLPDLAIGAPGEDIGSVKDAGAVTVLRGAPGPAGLTTTGAVSFNQNTYRIPGGAEAGDRFGGEVRLTDANGDKLFGLLAAAPGENTGDGFVWVIPAVRGTGLVAKGTWTYNGATLGGPTANAKFGSAIDE
ncbi:FG-GAP repeat protein [Streptomyces sp. NPDC051940]|uniref:FG-GAP repeat protein n=1 Tax=Streptomyces sp. NPDC051940 TaxID=3155675 RepID=UPI0034209E8D